MGRMELKDGLPPSVADIIEFAGTMAEGYGYLKWNEQAMLKADMMNARQRWMRVDLRAIKAKCLAVGLTREESDEIVDWVKRTQQGRRLVPAKPYRDHRFPAPVESATAEAIEPIMWSTTPDW